MHAVVSLDSAKTILLPASFYEKGLEEDYLRFNGMEIEAGERAVASEPCNGMVAVMGVPVRNIPPESECFTSPLLSITHGRKRDINIFLTSENAHIAVWDKGLCKAEVLPDRSADSLLYYMQVLGREFKLRKFDIYVSGFFAEDAADVLRQYFANVHTA